MALPAPYAHATQSSMNERREAESTMLTERGSVRSRRRMAMSGRDEELLRSLASRIDPADAGAHNNMGVVFYQKGLIDDAVRAFERALELDPRLDVARANIALALRESGHFDRRVAALKDGIQRNPGDIGARDALARTYLLAGIPERAAREWAVLLRHQPNNASLHIKLAFAESERGNLKGAMTLLDAAVRLAPELPTLHLQRAELLHRAGDMEGAVAAVRRALELDHDSARAHLLLSRALDELGMTEEAAAERDRARLLNPGVVETERHLTLARYITTRDDENGHRHRPQAVDARLRHLAQASDLRRTGDLSGAAAELEQALAADGDAIEARQSLAEVRLLQGRLQTALDLYDRLLEAEEESPKLWNERGVVLHRLGRLEDAIESYRESVAIDYAYGLGWSNLGVARAQLGEDDAAERALRKAAEDSAVPEVLWNLGLFLNLHGQMEEAVEVYAAAVKADKMAAESWNRLGSILFQSDRPRDAKRALDRALELDPDLAEARYQLGFTLSALGDFKGALRETKRAMQQASVFPAPRYQLLVDVQFEDGTLPAPDTDLPERVDAGQAIEAFDFEHEALDEAFAGFGAMGAPDPAEVEATMEEAERALRQGRHQRAADLAGRAVGMLPAAPEPRLLQARIYLMQGLAGEALERYLQILDLGQDHAAEAAEGRVRALLQLRRSREAVPAAEAAVTMGAPRSLLGQALLQAGDAESAVEVFQRVVDDGDPDPDTLRSYAEALLAVGRPAQAEPIFRRALEDSPSVSTRVGLAQALYHTGDRDQAEAVYVQAVETLPSYAPAAMGLAELRWQDGRRDEALRTLVTFLTLDPGHVEGLIRLGTWLHETGRPKQAAHALGRALHLDPTAIRARRVLNRIRVEGH